MRKETAHMTNSLTSEPVLVYIEDGQSIKTDPRKFDNKAEVPSWKIAGAIAGRAATFGRYTY